MSEQVPDPERRFNANNARLFATAGLAASVLLLVLYGTWRLLQHLVHWR